MAVPGLAGVDDLAGGHLERGEQRGGAVADVVVGGLLRQPGPHRQDRRGPLQGLDLRFLVDAEHHGVLRRVQIQPDHVADLGLQFRIGGELERLDPPGLQVPAAPDPRHRREAEIPSSAASSRLDQCVTPSRCGGGVNVATTTSASSTRRGRPERLPVLQRAQPALRVAIPPVDHRRPAHPDPGRDLGVRVPSPASSTIRARCASPARIDDARSHRDSSARSESGSSTAVFNGIAKPTAKLSYFIHATLAASSPGPLLLSIRSMRLLAGFRVAPG